jgi:hypothetical protein
MTLIPVPRPSKSAHNPDRPVNALLQAQIEHLHHAERNLPLRYRTEIYANAIRTEGEAATYIRDVTEAIHRAHEDAAAQRTQGAPKRKRGLVIAAAAERPARKSRSKAKAKTKSSSSKRKKK